MPKRLFAEQPLVSYASIVSLAFVLVRFALPSIIHAANKYKLYDSNDLHRKEHAENISRLGGLGIFCGFTITVLLFATTVNYQEANFLIASSILLLALGIKDDIYGVSPTTKFVLQIIVALILVFLGDFRLSSLYGVFEIWDLHPIAGGIFSVALVIFINNAFNLIDGIDGLAGAIGAVVSFLFGLFFALHGNLSYAFIAFSMLGAVLGFLVFNFPPAKIFMGDTGSLIIGLVSAVLAIKFIEINKVGTATHYFISAPATAVAVLIIPIFDSLRIFFIRIVNKSSPFRGDRNHIHHRLLRLGLSVKQILLLAVSFNLAIVGLTFAFSHLGNFILILLQTGVCVALNCVLTYVKRKRKAKYNIVEEISIEEAIKLS